MTLAKIPRYWKSVVAFVAALGVIVTQVIQSTLADGKWTREDTFVAVIAIAGWLGVTAKGNAPAPVTTNETTPRDLGAINWLAVIAICVLIIAVIIVLSVINVNVK